MILNAKLYVSDPTCTGMAVSTSAVTYRLQVENSGTVAVIKIGATGEIDRKIIVPPF